jgi:hypothetical protein
MMKNVRAYGLTLALLMGAVSCGPPIDQDSISLLMQQVPAPAPSISAEIWNGPLDDGTALVRSVDGGPKAAYWVFGGRVYAVNDAATKEAPDIPLAPAEITMERVNAVVK